MVKVMEAPHYRSCNSCGSGDRVIEITVLNGNKQGIQVALCKDCAKKLRVMLSYSHWRDEDLV